MRNLTLFTFCTYADSGCRICTSKSISCTLNSDAFYSIGLLGADSLPNTTAPSNPASTVTLLPNTITLCDAILFPAPIATELLPVTSFLVPIAIEFVPLAKDSFPAAIEFSPMLEK